VLSLFFPEARQQLIDKEHQFETDEGAPRWQTSSEGARSSSSTTSSSPEYKAGCPSCSTIADGFNGFVVHLANHDVTLTAVSRAPLAKLQAYKRWMRWTFPWASWLGGNFNFDFTVSITEEQQRSGAVEHNYRRETGAAVGRQLRGTAKTSFESIYCQVPGTR
jgi:predicted dithiol-disulfide oxidoreductase (DUF899 family)